MATVKEEVERIKLLASTQKKPESFTDVMTRITGKEYKPLTQATPYEEVLANYTLPFPLYLFQADTVNELGPEPKVGLYWDMGTGKTITAIVMTLLKFITDRADRAVVIMPPILLDQWAKILTSMGLTVQIYRGTPAVRKKLQLGAAQFCLVGIQIFKREADRFAAEFDTSTAVVLDEAQSVKNVASENYKKFTRFTADKSILLLSGTPVSSPEDAYAFIKQVAPSIYRTKGQFLNIHAGGRDFFNQIISWKNLDVLAENMRVNSSRVLKEDVLKDLPEVTYTPLFYQLEPGHAALYKQLAEEQLLQIGEGKLDATGTSKLYHALGQIICNYDHFSGDPDKRSTCFDLLDQTMEELGPTAKLVVFASYRMTNRKLLAYLQKYGAVAAYGDQTITQNMRAVDMFVGDPDCRVFVAQPTSVGTGVDGLQDVCRDGLFLEIPTVRDFHQAVDRLHRQGQKNGVHIRIGTAEGTIQVRHQKNLLDKDELVNHVVRNVEDLRKAIYGG